MASETSPVGIGNSSKIKHVRTTIIRFTVLCVGFALVFGSSGAVVFLQSSMNVVGSLGILGLALAYTVSVVFSIFFVPSLVRRFGCRYCWLFSNFTNLLYVLANFHPATYTIIPAGFLVGIGESVLWSCIPMVYIYFANQHSLHGSRPIKAYIRQYTGGFYITMQSSAIGGNLISWLVLFYSHGLGSEDANETQILLNNSSNGIDRYRFCGANDCQDSNTTQTNLDRYVPDQYSTYVLLSVFSLLITTAIVLHYRVVPDLKTCATEMKIEFVASMLENNVEKKTTPSVQETVKATFKHLVKMQQLLISPFLLYYGCFVAYIATELTRAFVSCTMGVEQVGIVGAVFAASSVFTSFAYSKLAGRFGRNALVPIIGLFDIANYFFNLLWKPEPGTLWIVYVSLVFFGVADGFWKNFTTDFMTDYFRKNQEIAFTVWNILITLGIAVQMILGSATSLCVGTKIYMMIGMCAFSLVSYAIGERRYLRRVSKSSDAKY